MNIYPLIFTIFLLPIFVHGETLLPVGDGKAQVVLEPMDPLSCPETKGGVNCNGRSPAGPYYKEQNNPTYPGTLKKKSSATQYRSGNSTQNNNFAKTFDAKTRKDANGRPISRCDLARMDFCRQSSCNGNPNAHACVISDAQFGAASADIVNGKVVIKCGEPKEGQSWCKCQG